MSYVTKHQLMRPVLSDAGYLKDVEKVLSLQAISGSLTTR
jgi:hypothetical protein